MNKAILRRDLEDIFNSIEANTAQRCRLMLQMGALDKELLQLDRGRERLERQRLAVMEKLNKEEQENG